MGKKRTPCYKDEWVLVEYTAEIETYKMRVHGGWIYKDIYKSDPPVITMIFVPMLMKSSPTIVTPISKDGLSSKTGI